MNTTKSESKLFREFAHKVYSLMDTGSFDEALDQIDSYINNGGNELNVAGLYIDIGGYKSDETIIRKGISLYENALKSQSLSKEYKRGYTYNSGNAYSSLYNFNMSIVGRDNYRAFKHNKDLLMAKEYFEKSLLAGNKEPSLLVNYGNTLDQLGRSIEAIEYYDKAIEKDPGFGMAYGSKAIAIIAFARISGNYQTSQYIFAYQLFEKALSLKDSVLSFGGKQAFDHFKSEMNKIENLFKKNKRLLKKKLNHPTYSYKGLSKFNKKYIEIATENDLFLNLHIHDKKCSEYISDHVFISLITPIGDNTTFYKFATWINEMKESFMTARYLTIRSQIKTKTLSNISKLTDIAYPLDYSTKTIYTGLLKSSIKDAFSILDKIAYFLDQYMNLGIKNKEGINWKNFWFDESKSKKISNWFTDKSGFNQVIQDTDNYLLFALFSLFLDIDKTDLPQIRHDLTHKKRDVFMMFKPDDKTSLSEDELFAKSLELLKYTKLAIIYLINFVNTQENAKRIDGKFIPTMYFITDQFI